MENKERAVNLSWTWYLLLGAIILMVMGITIGWGLYASYDVNQNNLIKRNLAVMICNILSLILVVLFYYFDSKDIRLIKVHVPKKYITLYFVAGIMFAVTIVISTIYFSFTDSMVTSLVNKAWTRTDSRNLVYGLGFGLIALFGLISVGLYRYVRFKIDLIMYRRRHGEKTNAPSGEASTTVLIDPSLASTGLTENATKE